MTLSAKNDFHFKDLEEEYNKLFGNKFFMTKVIIKDFRKEIPKHIIKRIKFYFPFVYKEMGRSCFTFKKGQEYEVGFYELLFLSFFEFDFIKVYSIQKGEDPLNDYLKELYKKRSIDPANKAFYKLFLNIGFGIFLTKNQKSEFIKDDKLQRNLLDNFNQSKYLNQLHFKEGINEETFTVKQIGKKFFKIIEGKNKWTKNSIPVIGLNIVSNARFIMYSAFLNDIFVKDKNEDFNIYYTDTDSLFCSQKFKEKLEANNWLGNELGQFKDEAEDAGYEITNATFLAPKSYFYNYVYPDGKTGIEIKLKGTGKDFRRTFVQQSFTTKFNIIDKVSFTKTTAQKRTLKNNLFQNKMSGLNYQDIWEDTYSAAEKELSELRLLSVLNNEKIK
jgi:hypothetical protein